MMVRDLLVQLDRLGARDTETRFSLRGARYFAKHNVRRVIFEMGTSRSTLGEMVEMVHAAACLGPGSMYDSSLRCFLWQDPFTLKVLDFLLHGKR